MLIDCDTCTARPTACDDCVVGVLLGTPTVPGAEPAAPAGPGDPLPDGFGPVERRALEVLADHGLIPRLRLVPLDRGVPTGRETPGSAGPGARRTRDVG